MSLEEKRRLEKSTTSLLQKEREKQRRKAKKRLRRKLTVYTIRFLTVMAAMLLVAFFVLTIKVIRAKRTTDEPVLRIIEEIVTIEKTKKVIDIPKMEVSLLTPNEYSRPQEALEQVDHIFVHYTANPGTTAMQNRSYFENLGITGETSASAHFVIGYEGEIVQCIPTTEIAYAVKENNYNSISIECCYLAEDGSFTQATYDSLIELLAFLVGKFDLTSEDILRHYDSNGKLCPLYYANHENKWKELKRDVERYIEKYGTTEYQPAGEGVRGYIPLDKTSE